MQSLALEIGFSETTFVLPAEEGGTARVRIFTPRHELPIAGHPVLGTAWVLAQPLQRGVIELETGMGIVPVEIDRDESGALVFGRMDAARSDRSRAPRSEALFTALGVDGSELPVERTTTVRRTSSSPSGAPTPSPRCRPDLAALAALDVKA